MYSSIYKYYLNSGDHIECFMCQYSYRINAPLSTLQKHLRVKHGYSIRSPPTHDVYSRAIQRAKLTNLYKVMNRYKSFTRQVPLPPSRRITINELLN
ncbi:hypothetical protein DSO57_1008954 [Entomophthora muscae]|uniref:Uncharacterized protein n=1 Tax=Entomophthora muscae TaxID=34485 RepID=A0ACC2U4Z9_9FUNG|nr:hypothetical protein DSO57_1008954 [Entomophthora muscae]